MPIARPPTAPPPLDETAAWEAALCRDRSADGRFVFAVKSTGIYCRPSCPARRPLRKNVEFFATARLAETGGFRPCRRCDPQSTRAAPPEQIVKAALRFIDDHLDQPLTLEVLASRMGYSKYHFLRLFTREVGVSPQVYQTSRRREQLRKSPGRLNRTTPPGASAASLGMTLAAYRRGGRGIHISFAIADSALGRVLVAATQRGVCAVFLADNDSVLQTNLREEFPQATIESAPDSMTQAVEAVIELIEGKPTSRQTPIDLQGTVFQMRVWDALRRIPRGQTWSYSELARQIGSPAAFRAAAGACANNRVAILVPCHRIIRESGHLGGYRWGIDRKQKLLENEKP